MLKPSVNSSSNLAAAKRPSIDLEADPNFIPKTSPQIIAALIASIGAFALGSAVGWSSIAIPSLKSSGDLGEISESNETWMGSIIALGGATSGFFVGPLMGKFGRKNTILLLQFPFFAGWILIASANSVGMILAGRMLTGIVGAAMTMIVPIYISEIVEDRIRGTLSSFMPLGLSSGILFSYIVGSFVSWKWLAIINAFIPVAASSIYFLPDSPTSLLSQNKEHAAQKALVWFRGAPSFKQIETEIKQIQISLSESNQLFCGLKELLVGSVLKPVGISLALMFFQQFGGITALIKLLFVLFYSVSIFKSAGTNLNPNICAILIGIVQVIVTVLNVVLIDRLGRKPILIFSKNGVMVCLVALGIFFHLKSLNNDEAPEGLGWLPLTSLILYIATYGVGLGPISWVFLSELTPSHIKGFACGFVNSFCWGLGFVVSKTFPDLCLALTPQGCYWLFGGITAIGALFTIFVVPETKGKSLDEINALFR